MSFDLKITSALPKSITCTPVSSPRDDLKSYLEDEIHKLVERPNQENEEELSDQEFENELSYFLGNSLTSEILSPSLPLTEKKSETNELNDLEKLVNLTTDDSSSETTEEDLKLRDMSQNPKKFKSSNSKPNEVSNQTEVKVNPSPLKLNLEASVYVPKNIDLRKNAPQKNMAAPNCFNFLMPNRPDLPKCEGNSLFEGGQFSLMKLDFPLNKNTKKENKKKKKKELVERKGDWPCYDCKNLNFSFRVRCNKCGLDKQVSEKKFVDAGKAYAQLAEQHRMALELLKKK